MKPKYQIASNTIKEILQWFLLAVTTSKQKLSSPAAWTVPGMLLALQSDEKPGLAEVKPFQGKV